MLGKQHGMDWTKYNEGAAAANLLMHHLSYLRDERRMSRFAQGIAKCVRKGDWVLDIGTGSGILAFMALEAGAAHVFAAEHSPDMLNMAKRLARNNGYTDRITFIEGRFQEHPVPDRARHKIKALITETLGTWGPNEGTAGLILAAKKNRWLAPGARILPRRLTSYWAPLECPGLRRYYFGALGKSKKPDFAPYFELMAQLPHNVHRSNYTLIAKPQPLLHVDLAEISTTPFPFEKNARFTCDKGSVLDGFLLWYTVELAPGVKLDTLRESFHWSQVFLPVHPSRRFSKRTSVPCKLRATETEILEWGVGSPMQAFGGAQFMAALRG